MVIAPWYPTYNSPNSGIFIHEQVKSLKRVSSSISIDVIEVIPYVPVLLGKVIKKYKKYERVPNEYEYEGIKIKTIKVFTLPRNLNTPFMCKSLSKKIIKYLYDNQVNYDIIHAHGAVHAGYAAVKACIEHRIKCVVTVHGSDIMYYADLNKSMRKISDYILSNADLLIAISEDIAKSIYRRNSTAKVQVLYTGIDFNKFDITINSNRQNDKTKIIFVGNILFSKGVFDLIEAFKIINKKGYNCELTFCGRGNDEKTLMNLCKNDGIYNVSFLGAVRNDELPEILSEHDILVLPSHREGLGTVLLEALAMGKLVVGANVGGIPEIISDGINGFLFRARDVNSLTDSLEKAILNYKNVNPYFLRSTIQNKFDIDNNSLVLYKIYSNLVSRNMK